MAAKKSYLTIAAYARSIGVSRQRVLQWINEGRLPCRVISGVRRIPETAKRPARAKTGPKIPDSVRA